MKSPFASLAKAIEIAKSKKMRVYACSGEYIGSVTVPGGVAIYGGLDCMKSWEATSATSNLQGEPGTIPLRLQAGAGGSAPIVLDHLRVEAALATVMGGSSIAAIAEELSVVELNECELVANNGMDGAPGEPALSTPIDTPKVSTINEGKEACYMNLSQILGGEQFKNICGPEEQSVGGAGGDGFINSGDDGQPGIPDLEAGSAGQTGVACNKGGAGELGADGINGADGAMAEGIGTLSTTLGWVGIHGGDGGKGTPGQGGGGGAGQKNDMMAVCAGASGGSGGAGGCGGLGGGGGKAGGASIALVSIKATITMTGVKLTAGDGGRGGNGGNAQTGSKGGLGAPGGSANQPLLPGCDGGKGGNGGSGGQGGGGSGGHSLGIARIMSTITGAPLIVLGVSGEGGTDANGMNSGDKGLTKETQEFTQLSGS